LKSALVAIRKRSHDIGPETVERIVELAESAELPNDSGGSAAAQEAVALFNSAVAEAHASVPFNPATVKRTRSYFDGFTNEWVTEQTDQAGKKRETFRGSTEQVAENVTAAKAAADPWEGRDPNNMNLAQIEQALAKVERGPAYNELWMDLANRAPDKREALMLRASERMDEAGRARRGY
jgi:hypothetical protein